MVWARAMMWVAWVGEIEPETKGLEKNKVHVRAGLGIVSSLYR